MANKETKRVRAHVDRVLDADSLPNVSVVFALGSGFFLAGAGALGFFLGGAGAGVAAGVALTFLASQQVANFAAASLPARAIAAGFAFNVAPAPQAN